MTEKEIQEERRRFHIFLSIVLISAIACVLILAGVLFIGVKYVF